MIRSKVVSLSNNTHVTLNVDNARIIRVSPLLGEVERRDEENDIIELNYNNELRIIKDKEFKVDKQLYKPISIKRVDSGGTGMDSYCLYNYDLNKCTNFILPLLIPNPNYTRQHFRWLDFCNCFIGTQSEADYGDYIYLLYRYSGDTAFIKFDKFLTDYEYFEEKMNVDNFHTLYKFKVNPLVLKDYQLILSGKYSHISEFSKKQILDFHYLENESVTYKILYKSEERKKELENKYDIKIPKDLDLYDKFIPEDEMYMEKYKIKNNIHNEFTAENSDYC